MNSEPGWLRGFLIFRLPLLAVAGLALKGPLSELYIYLLGSWWQPGLHWAIYSIILYFLSLPARFVALGVFAGVFALVRLAAAWRSSRESESAEAGKEGPRAGSKPGLISPLARASCPSSRPPPWPCG